MLSRLTEACNLEISQHRDLESILFWMISDL